jgi:hypothetical protein
MVMTKVKIQSLMVNITVSAALILLFPSSDSIKQRIEDAALNILVVECVTMLLDKGDQS